MAGARTRRSASSRARTPWTLRWIVGAPAASVDVESADRRQRQDPSTLVHGSCIRNEETKRSTRYGPAHLGCEQFNLRA